MPVVLTPIINPSASDVTSVDSLGVILPQLSRVFDEQLHQRMRGVVMQQGRVASIQVQMFRTDGRPVSLADVGVESGSSSSSQSAGVGSVAGKAWEAVGGPCEPYDADVTVIDAENGIVRAVVPQGVRETPGIYFLEIGVLNAADELQFVYPLYIFVEQSGWGTAHSPAGPPRYNDIKLSLRDSDIYENLLVDDHSFDIAEVCMATTRVVRLWNEQPPSSAGMSYTTRTFPFRNLWIKGIQYYLFQLAEEDYRKNKLQYSAGGTSTDDKNRDREYRQAWTDRYQEFFTALKNQKYSMNMRRGMRSIRQG